MTDKRKVLKPFRDKEDRKRAYGTGGLYPRDGFDVSAERLTYLADNGYIEKVEKEETFDESNTVKEIEAELERLDIEYNKTDNKAEKLALLNDSDDR